MAQERKRFISTIPFVMAMVLVSTLSLVPEATAQQGRGLAIGRQDTEQRGNQGRGLGRGQTTDEDLFPPPATVDETGQEATSQSAPSEDTSIGPTGGAEVRGQGNGNGNGGGRPSTGWEDDFNRTTVANPIKGKRGEPRWIIADRRAPGYKAGNHYGVYDPTHVGISDGVLVLVLTQETGTVDGNTNGVLSYGAEIYTQDSYGYGTYEWHMRMSSTDETPESDDDPFNPQWPPKSGSVSAGFLYTNNSETEIDFEYSGHVLDGPEPPNQPFLDDDLLHMVNWYNVTPGDGPVDSEATASRLPLLGTTSEFKTYKFVWEPGRITYYACDSEVCDSATPLAVHTENVPSAPASFRINHWGTNGPWGGAATLDGVPPYFYVDWVRYTPLP